MTINVHCPRLGDRERRLFELISSMYPGAPWYKHIAIVWTRCYSVMANQIENCDNDEEKIFLLKVCHDANKILNETLADENSFIDQSSLLDQFNDVNNN